MRLRMHQKDSIIRNATTLVMQIPEKNCATKNLRQNTLIKKIKDSQQFNPQFNIDWSMLNTMTVLGFCTWIWDRIVFELRSHVIMHMIVTINRSLQSSGSNCICSYHELSSWINSIQGMMIVDTLQFVLFGTWVDKK